MSLVFLYANISFLFSFPELSSPKIFLWECINTLHVFTYFCFFIPVYKKKKHRSVENLSFSTNFINLKNWYSSIMMIEYLHLSLNFKYWLNTFYSSIFERSTYNINARDYHQEWVLFGRKVFVISIFKQREIYIVVR